MTRFESKTMYRCDGCGIETGTPSGWKSIINMNIVDPRRAYDADHYCLTCTDSINQLIAQIRERGRR
jgi:hypothetical protein